MPGGNFFINDLKIILGKIFHEKHDFHDIKELVKISQVIVVSYLKNVKPTSIGLCRMHGLTLPDLANDCIMEIFARDNSGIPRTMKNFYSSLRLTIDELPANEIYFAYKAMLLKIAYAHISYLYAQHDPSGFKIQRNIKETVLKTNLFQIKKTILGVMLVVTDGSQCLNLPYLNMDGLQNEFMHQTINLKHTGELLKVLYNCLNNQNEFRKEIKLSDAVYLFKSVYGIKEIHSIDDGDDEWNKMFTNSVYEDFEIEQVTNKVLDKMKAKIIIDYYSAGKLTKEQSEAIFLSIGDVVHDWIALGKNHIAFHEYLSKYIELSSEEYHRIIRDKLEYLIKETRKEFKLYLMSNE